jgi:uncharacterized protein (DUF2147 family)
MTMFRRIAITLFVSAGIASAQSQSTVLGTWREPGGSVIDIFKCGTDICAKMAAISPQAPSRVDVNNPNPKERTHPLCGLQIGYGFHLGDSAHADGGKLYDPKSGKTYRGTMTAEGSQLHLRGYVGFKAFGRSEVWTRTHGTVAACPK